MCDYVYLSDKLMVIVSVIMQLCLYIYVAWWCNVSYHKWDVKMMLLMEVDGTEQEDLVSAYQLW